MRVLGERWNDFSLLEQAADACAAALRVYTRENMRRDHAMTQTNLGNALSALGARTGDPAKQETAIAAYRIALDCFTAEEDGYRAVARYNLALAEKRLRDAIGE